MENRQEELEVETGKSAQSLEDALRVLWDRVRAAADMVTRLKQEKRAMFGQVSTLEREVASLRSELQTREQEMKRLRQEHTQLLNAQSSAGFTPDERENLKNKIRDLVAKINSHL